MVEKVITCELSDLSSAPNCWMFLFVLLCHAVRRILIPQSGIKLAPPTLEVEVLTTGLPGKSPNCYKLGMCDLGHSSSIK